MQFLVRRATTDTTEHDALDTHCIGSPKNSAHVVLAAHVIQYDHQRQFVRFVVFRHAHASHLGCGQFLTHNANGNRT